MNKLLAAMMMKGGAYVPPVEEQPPGVLLPKARMGANLSGMARYDHGSNITMNMLAQSESWRGATYGDGYIGQDANGWPAQDFSVVLHELDYSDVTQYCLGRFTGYAATVAIEFGGPVVTNKVYDAGTNTTTFTIEWPPKSRPDPIPAVSIKFNGTRRTGGASGTTNTGLTNVVILHPDCTFTQWDAGERWTPSYIAYQAPFAAHRLMDLWEVNNLPFKQWADMPRDATTHVRWPTIEDGVKLANLFPNQDFWLCIPATFDDASVAAMIQYFEDNVDPGITIRWEFGNETWNFLLGSLYAVINATCRELKGFAGQAWNRGRGFSYTRTGGVVTLTTQNEPHEWTNGQTIVAALQGSPTNKNPTVTVVDAMTVTFEDGGSDISSNNNGNDHVLGTTDSTLWVPGGRTFNIGVVGIERYTTRRLMEISNIARSIVGDAKMHTRHKFVYANQVGGGGFNTYALQYIKTQFPAHPVKYYFTEWALAPYTNSTYNFVSGATYEQCVQGIIDSANLNTGNGSIFEWRAHRARRYGLDSICYEGGMETQFDAGTTQDKVLRNQAKFDPRIKDAVRDYLAMFFRRGGKLFCWYNNGPFDRNNTSQYTWGFTDSYTNFDAPLFTAIRETQTMDIEVNRNVIPGTFSGANSTGNLPGQPAVEINTYGGPNSWQGAPARDDPEQERWMREFYIYAAESGDYKLRVQYQFLPDGAGPSNATWRVQLDGTLYETALAMNKVDLVNDYWTAEVTIPGITVGFHALDLQPNEGQIRLLQFKQLEMLKA